MGGDSPSDAIVLRDAVGEAVRFTYRNSLALVGVSLLWFVAVLPVVTFGPATVGAYRAVVEIRESGSTGLRSVLGTVRQQLVHAVLLGLLPFMFGGVTLFYAAQYNATGDTITLVLFLAAFYVGTYLWMLSIPTFVALAHGERGYDAISFGHAWLRGHVTLALLTVVLTAVFGLVLALLTIAFPAFFAGVAAAFHVEVVDEAYVAWAAENADQADGAGVDEVGPAV